MKENRKNTSAWTDGLTQIQHGVVLTNTRSSWQRFTISSCIFSETRSSSRARIWCGHNITMLMH